MTTYEKYEHEWEDVQSPQTNDYLERIAVPGGWIYRCWRVDTDEDTGKLMPPVMAMVFVPSPPQEA